MQAFRSLIPWCALVASGAYAHPGPQTPALHAVEHGALVLLMAGGLWLAVRWVRQWRTQRDR